MEQAEVVICGAGIAGIAAGYFLAVKQGFKKVVLVDERPPLTFTSDKSTECYRNWWPGPGDEMVRFMDRSIDLLEELALESNNFFGLNRRGYIYLTADPATAVAMAAEAQTISDLGAGPLRRGEGYRPSPAHGWQDQPTGADWLTDPAQIRAHYPFLAEDVVGLLHARRCGWLSAQQLGMYLLDKAKAHGLHFVSGKVTAVDTVNGRIHSVQINHTDTIATPLFVNAAGPHVAEVGQLLGVDIPVYNELHGKISFTDHLAVVPRHLPLMIWNDPITLPWQDEEREALAEDPETAWLTRPFPAGIHFRPEGEGQSQILLMLWAYDVHRQEPVAKPSFNPLFPEVVLRGMSRMIPGLGVYVERMAKPWVDGGYYCKTRENRPLIGPLPVEGAFVLGALSGYGIMAAMAGAELLTAHITGQALPAYAPAFHLRRYEEPAYQALLANWDALAGQL